MIRNPKDRLSKHQIAQCTAADAGCRRKKGEGDWGLLLFGSGQRARERKQAQPCIVQQGKCWAKPGKKSCFSQREDQSKAEVG